MKLSLLGMVGAGKTTFLAALWHTLLESQEVGSRYKASSLPDDRVYLNAIRRAWLDISEIDRTKRNSQQSPRIHIQATGHPAVDLVVPDLAGELCESVVEEGDVESLQDVVSESTGILLFVHPLKVNETFGIIDIALPESAPGIDSKAQAPETSDARSASKSAGLLAQQPNGDGQRSTHQVVPIDWTTKCVSAQVRHVQLLQFVQSICGPGLGKIAIVISAWDRLAKKQLPTKWVSDRMPALFQFLTAQSDQIEFKVFGVSAQGGDLETDLKRLRKFAKHSERITLCTDVDRTHDLTLIIEWLTTSAEGAQ